MAMRRGAAWLVQPHHSQIAEVIGRRVEIRVLSGQDDGRLQPALAKRGGDRTKFDGFGAGPYDQPDIRAVQCSPWLGRINLPPLWTKGKWLRG